MLLCSVSDTEGKWDDVFLALLPMNSMCTVESYVSGRKRQQQTLVSAVPNVLPLLHTVPNSRWRAQHSPQHRPCWVLSLKPGAHTRQSSKGSGNQGSHSDPNMGNSKEDHEEMAFLYGSWPVLERAAVDMQSSQEECLQGDLWRRAPTVALCVDTPEGHTWKAHHFLCSSFYNTIMFPTYMGWSVVYLTHCFLFWPWRS